jgi:hypothetical protein
MSPRLLQCIDLFRTYWGNRCVVSPNPDALGRRLGPDAMSGHNIDRWGLVEAVDLFPLHMDEPEDLARAYSCARSACATGIGLYTDTKPGNMIHIDTRPDRHCSNPRLWSRVDKTYGAIDLVMPDGWKR